MAIPARLRNALIAAASAGAIAIGGVLITDQEGVKYTPYLDPVGIPTVCAGVTGPDVVMGKTYTKSECDNLLYKHMLPAVKAVDSSVKVKLNDYQKASLYSFTYNVGINAFRSSTLLVKLNQGDLPGACNQLRRWTYAGGKQWKGLITRREVERQLCYGKP
ncbi:lysozyme [Enterobacter sp. R1(2018)]|uniref:lysozyme n=1 Tax=Enterobacter sp. R1(2018) TaxID=2447891 RepID=UPI000EB3B3EF|nr:lysozyme [Enterobacter sp. R1(2018)]RKQ38382.1 lysozyme [Enterobacter sp. R1(2018)]